MSLKSRKSFIINTLFFGICAVLIYLVIRFALVFLFPFLIGIILAYAMKKPANAISKKLKIKSSICSCVLVGITFIFVIALLSLLIYGIVCVGNTLVKKTPEIINEIQGLGDKIKEAIGIDLIKQISGSGIGWLSDFTASAAKSVPSLILSCVVTVVASLYIAKDYEKIKRFFLGFVKQSYIKNAVIIKDIVIKNVFRIVWGYTLVAFITFFIAFSALFLLKFRHFLIFSLIIGLFDLLPVFGAGTVLVPWSVLSFISGDTKNAIYLLVIYFVIGAVRGFVEPRIIGDRVGLNPIFMLLSIFIGLRVSGVLGMLFVPMVVIVIYKFYKQQMELEAE